MRRPTNVPRSLALAAALSAGLALSLASGTFAASNPAGGGQPSAECGDEGAELRPHGFLSGGFEIAEAPNAGSDDPASLLHARSGHAVSQYDVACFQFSSSH
jgi:hypothetical protein